MFSAASASATKVSGMATMLDINRMEPGKRAIRPIGPDVVVQMMPPASKPPLTTTAPMLPRPTPSKTSCSNSRVRRLALIAFTAARSPAMAKKSASSRLWLPYTKRCESPDPMTSRRAPEARVPAPDPS